MQHIVISNTGLHLLLDGIDDPAFGLGSLRVLIIRKSARPSRGYWSATLEHRPDRRGRLNLPLPGHEDGSAEDAERIARFFA